MRHSGTLSTAPRTHATIFRDSCSNARTMYTAHFGLHQAPFSITPNPAFFYPGNTRGEILEALLYAVSHGEGIIKVTGEVGAGKTMLCLSLIHI